MRHCVLLLGYPRSKFFLTVHYTEVLKAVFDYIALLRQSFPLAPYHYTEVSTMARTRFTFREKAQPHVYASSLARSFADPYPPEWLISGASLYRKYDEDITRQLLEGFVPERTRVLLMAKNHREEVVGSDPQWASEKWYGTRYIVRKLDDALLQRVSPIRMLLFDRTYRTYQLRGREVNPELCLPGPNPFIPTDLSVEKSEVAEVSHDGFVRVVTGMKPLRWQPVKFPTLIKRTERAQLWYKKDDQFWVPKARVYIVIKTYVSFCKVSAVVLMLKHSFCQAPRICDSQACLDDAVSAVFVRSIRFADEVILQVVCRSGRGRSS